MINKAELWKWYRNEVFTCQQEYPNLIAIERAKRAYWFHNKCGTLSINEQGFKYHPY